MVVKAMVARVSRSRPISSSNGTSFALLTKAAEDVTAHWQPRCLEVFRELLQDTFNQAASNVVVAGGARRGDADPGWQSFFAVGNKS